MDTADAAAPTESTAESTTTIADLPKDCIVLIFGLCIPSQPNNVVGTARSIVLLSLVCRRWKSYAARMLAAAHLKCIRQCDTNIKIPMPMFDSSTWRDKHGFIIKVPMVMLYYENKYFSKVRKVGYDTFVEQDGYEVAETFRVQEYKTQRSFFKRIKENNSRLCVFTHNDIQWTYKIHDANGRSPWELTSADVKITGCGSEYDIITTENGCKVSHHQVKNGMRRLTVYHADGVTPRMTVSNEGYVCTFSHVGGTQPEIITTNGLIMISVGGNLRIFGDLNGPLRKMKIYSAVMGVEIPIPYW